MAGPSNEKAAPSPVRKADAARTTRERALRTLAWGKRAACIHDARNRLRLPSLVAPRFARPFNVGFEMRFG